jgi:hypothetical protein
MNTKLAEFIKRNRRRNDRLYQPGMIKGQDYVVCPISNERLSMIKDNYITCVLGMNVQDYPLVQRICQGRKENIKQGLQKINPDSGLTAYETGQIKARTVLKQVDESGLSGYDRKGQKTRATHMNNIDSLGRNGYSQLASKAIVKGNTTKANKGLISFANKREEFHRYKLIVIYLTEKYRAQLTEGYLTGLAGKPGAWHIDHKFSILKGYQLNISPFVIGNIKNLEMTPWKENISKHAKCSITSKDLLLDCNYTEEQSSKEYAQIIDIICKDVKNNIPPNAAYLIERYYESTICS